MWRMYLASDKCHGQFVTEIDNHQKYIFIIFILHFVFFFLGVYQ